MVIPDGAGEEEISALRVRGAIVLTRDIERARSIAVDRFGAVGIIYDGFRRLRPVRQTGDLMEAVHLARLGSGRGHKRTFGFVVSPREGLRLRQLVEERRRRGLPPPKLAARVRARTYNGTYQILTAAIPGSGRQQVLVLAHLCHPQWSANDNASGCACAMELLRTIRSLIDSGKLAPLKRTIRILLVPEYAGSYIYLSRHPGQVRRSIAGINLDMVGEDQDRCRTVLLLERPPAAAASFVGDLAEAIQWALPQRGTTPSSTDRFPLLRQAIVEFSGWSDHDVLSDPTVGIPSPMLIQWPDLFYHTTLDTIDKVDPASLHRAGALAATYCYFLATAGRREAEWVLAHCLGRFKERVVDAVRRSAEAAVAGGPQGTRRWLNARIRYLTELGCRTLDSVRTLAPVRTDRAKAELRAFAQRELDSVAPPCRKEPPRARPGPSAKRRGRPPEWCRFACTRDLSPSKST